MFRADKVQLQVLNLLWQMRQNLKITSQSTAKQLTHTNVYFVVDYQSSFSALFTPVHSGLHSQIPLPRSSSMYLSLKAWSPPVCGKPELPGFSPTHPPPNTYTGNWLGTANFYSSPINFSMPLTPQCPFGTSSMNMTHRGTCGLWTWVSSPSQHQQENLQCGSLYRLELPVEILYAPSGLLGFWQLLCLSFICLFVSMKSVFGSLWKARPKQKLLPLFIYFSQRSDIRDEPCFTQTRPALMWHRAHRQRGLVITT